IDFKWFTNTDSGKTGGDFLHKRTTRRDNPSAAFWHGRGRWLESIRAKLSFGHLCKFWLVLRLCSSPVWVLLCLTPATVCPIVLRASAVGRRAPNSRLRGFPSGLSLDRQVEA